MKSKKQITLLMILAGLFHECANGATKNDIFPSPNPEDSVSNTSVFPIHEPYGFGIGAKPGRVVWSHDPESVIWNGDGYWWQLENFDEPAIQAMIDKGVASLAATTTVGEGWKALFATHNIKRGKTGGYAKGQKIAIKINLNGSGTYGFNPQEKSHLSYTNPVLLRALLVSLVKEADVSPSDITVFDASRMVPVSMMQLCSQGILERICFNHYDPKGTNDAVANKSVPVVWSKEFTGATNYLPTCVTEAEYIINMANLKGHSYGITLCAKNHFGTIMNDNRTRPPEAANIHQFLTANKMGIYTVLVDLLSNYQLGEKTVLYMLDALIVALTEGSSVLAEHTRWQMTPFNGGYTASVFFSQDPVAIESVGADFLINEPTLRYNSALKDNPNVENHIHEASLVANPPSGTKYLNGNGKKVDNLGVHEHWNNPVEKKYSRNFGKAEGIELIYIH